ncbi:retropepsin-like domain-containing protein [Patescibacteria group bacterium]|nr:retropepsin-like domain-containing protein [Patescibacteria group bacterium]
MPNQQHAFTIRYNGLTRVLMTEVGVSIPFLGTPDQTQKIVVEKYQGIWDTGATGSVVTKRVVDKLGLKPIGAQKVYHAGGESVSSVYLVNIALPSNVMVQGVKVTEGDLPPKGGADLLIGMDIIGLGDFSVSHVGGKSTMSFRMPSCRETDYIGEANLQNMKSHFQKKRAPTSKHQNKKKTKRRKKNKRHNK